MMHEVAQNLLPALPGPKFVTLDCDQYTRIPSHAGLEHVSRDRVIRDVEVGAHVLSYGYGMGIFLRKKRLTYSYHEVWIR